MFILMEKVFENIIYVDIVDWVKVNDRLVILLLVELFLF